MRRHIASVMLIVCGTLLVAWSVGTWLLPTTASAMPTQQDPPPERPPVDPGDGDGGGGGGGGGSDDPTATPVPSGRITGTVINQSTGAPTPGIEVSVGGVIVRSDENGNYERTGLLPGTYTVKLWLGPTEGVPLQNPQAVALPAHENIIVHLFFRPGSASAPTSTPVPPPTGGSQLPAPALPDRQAMGLSEPVAAPAVPGSSAQTRAARTAPVAPAQTASETVANVPSQLPLTGAGTQGSLLWLWLALGAAMVIAGGLLRVSMAGNRFEYEHTTAAIDVENAETLQSLIERDL